MTSAHFVLLVVHLSHNTAFLSGFFLKGYSCVHRMLLLTVSFGFEESVTTSATSSKSHSFDIDTVLGFWLQIFQKDLLLSAAYCNI